jgi:menaquinone-dependent protoporphyrinogen IX oxidase
MRTAVVFFSVNKRDKLRAIAGELAKGIEEQGCYVDVIDANRDVNSKLTIYNYIAVGTEQLSAFGGKISESIQKYLANSGIVAGKRSFAFILGGGVRTSKTLTALMKNMEHEGMYLKYSEVINSPEDAREIGRQLHITS